MQGGDLHQCCGSGQVEGGPRRPVPAARHRRGGEALARLLFTEDANVRQVRAYFATKRAKFSTASPLVAAWAAAARS